MTLREAEAYPATSTADDADHVGSKYRFRRRRRRALVGSSEDFFRMLFAACGIASLVLFYHILVNPTTNGTMAFFWDSQRADDTEAIAVAQQLLAPALQHNSSTARAKALQNLFNNHRVVSTLASSHQQLLTLRTILKALLQEVNSQVHDNVAAGVRWTPPYHLPPLSAELAPSHQRYWQQSQLQPQPRSSLPDMATETPGEHAINIEFFKVRRRHQTNMAWQDEWNSMQQSGPSLTMDYTDPTRYSYPDPMVAPPATGGYPVLRSLRDILTDWPQNQDRSSAIVMKETLQHFNYSDPVDLESARRFRDAGLPFKVYDVPDLQDAARLWTDDYLSQQFDKSHKNKNLQGVCQESIDHFFLFFRSWNLPVLGLPPIRHNDWTYQKWAEHAAYADAVQLSNDLPHFYYQAGTDPDDRHRALKDRTFLTRDLPTLTAAKRKFFNFAPHRDHDDDGVQCRFGERGVVAATHQDQGRNMVALIKGAKRYILQPPNQCSKLGIVVDSNSPLSRHSLLNLGHIRYLGYDKDNDDSASSSNMSKEEIAWLERAATSRAVETVLKQGEVLYIPSHWFHYIESLQRSAQCNVRSGVDKMGTKEFGGMRDIVQCSDDASPT
jgi:hypothetical protein